APVRVAGCGWPTRPGPGPVGRSGCRTVGRSGRRNGSTTVLQWSGPPPQFGVAALVSPTPGGARQRVVVGGSIQLLRCLVGAGRGMGSLASRLAGTVCRASPVAAQPPEW